VKTPRLDVDFTDLAVVNDPYPVYEQIRATGRVVWNELAHGWMVPGFDDCIEVFDDPRGERFGVVGARRPEVTF
jgi:cytochrome P450